MLYDPSWEHKADPFTMEGLIAWLEKMPPAKRYDYANTSGNCVYGQYLAAHGVPWDESGATGFCDHQRADFCDRVYGQVALERPWTFGAALARARTAIMNGERA